ncbi:MAG TPA: hypothetical protein VIU16_15795 [Gaiellaceae bacterium]
MRTLPPLRQHAALALVAALAAGLALTIAPRPAQNARLTIAVEGRASVAELQRLLASEPVAAETIRNLRLAGTEPGELRRRLHVRALPAALEVRFADRSEAQAQRIAQELALVLSQSVHERYRGRAVASISEPVRPAGATARPWARNLLLAALAGFALAALTALVTPLVTPLAGRPVRAGVRRPRWGTMSPSAPTSHRKD